MYFYAYLFLLVQIIVYGLKSKTLKNKLNKTKMKLKSQSFINLVILNFVFLFGREENRVRGDENKLKYSYDWLDKYENDNLNLKNEDNDNEMSLSANKIVPIPRNESDKLNANKEIANASNDPSNTSHELLHQNLSYFSDNSILGIGLGKENYDFDVSLWANELLRRRSTDFLLTLFMLTSFIIIIFILAVRFLKKVFKKKNQQNFREPNHMNT